MWAWAEFHADGGKMILTIHTWHIKSYRFSLFSQLLVRIFSFLNPSDLMVSKFMYPKAWKGRELIWLLLLMVQQCVGLTCRRFLDASQYKSFTKNWCLNFSERYSSQFSVPIQSFAKCKRLFPTVMLHTGQVDDYATEDFWIYYGENLTELEFLSGLLTKDQFVNVGKYTKNLKSFKIEANNMFKSWTFNKFSFERRATFNNCSHIGIARNNFLSTDIFEFLMATSPNISSIDLSNCLQLMNPPERNRFLDYVLAFLRDNRRKIRSLNFANTITDDFFLDSLGRIDMQLKELHLTFMGSTKNSNYGLPVLVANQPTLEKFDLTASPNLNDIVVKLIASQMTNIRILLLKKCHNLTDHGVREIAKLVHLEVRAEALWKLKKPLCLFPFQSLEISDCDYVTDVGILDGVLSGPPKCHLRKLNLGLLQTLTEAVVLRMSYVYENLSALDLGGVSLAVTDNSLQMIFRHMRFLRYLNVDSCCKVRNVFKFRRKRSDTLILKLTDYGFTGVSSEYARRLHTIRNLKGLQVFRCNGIYKMTDFTLVDAFMMKELKEVYFSRCNVSQREPLVSENLLCFSSLRWQVSRHWWRTVHHWSS